jgi:cyclophilin family peptidyl-prolyl cis-trans isomerase
MHFSKIWDYLRTSTSAKQRKNRQSVRLAVEVLEDRSVPSATGGGMASGVVSGRMYVDTNHNGMFNVGEPILPGVAVTLSGSTSQNVVVNATATTDINGSFTFNNVLPGSYHIQAGPVTGLFNGATAVGIVNVPAGVNVTLPTALNSTVNIGTSGALNLANKGIGVGLFLTTTTESSLKFGAVAGSGVALANFRANHYPTISNTLANITAPENGTSMIDLAGHFSDADLGHTEVAFNITSNGTQQTINVNLNDATAPQNVANFLDYVKSGAYNNSIFSRLVQPDPTTHAGIAILQGGGVKLDSTAATGLSSIPTLPPVPLEYSAANPNAAFTLAAARTNDPNSATDQFFFNTADDTSNLGPNSQGPGYTVFGQIADAASQKVLTALAATRANNAINDQHSSPAAFANPSTDMTNVPLINYTGTNFGKDATAANFLVVNSVTVVHQDEVLTYTAHVTNAAGNPGLVTATVNNERLNLTYAAGQTGSATVTITATDRYGATLTSAPFTVTVTAAPVITSAPVALTGTVLSVAPVVTQLNNSPVTFAYQWLQGGSPIAGATSSTLDLSHSPLGHVNVGDTFTVQITPTDGNHVTGAVFTSNPSVVHTINPITINAPVITSVPVTLSGAVLTAAPVATDPNGSPITFTYQWLQGGVAISGATSATLDLSQSPLGNVQIGNTFSVKVTPTNGNNVTGFVFTSTPVTVTALNPITIAVNPPVITSAPVTINGTVLTAAPVATDPSSAHVNFTYQWLKGGVALPNATSASLDLAQLGNVQVGDVFTVRITPTDANNITGAVFTSAPANVTSINPIIINGNQPTVTSVLVQINATGNILQAFPVATSPNNSPITFNYQWLRGGVAIPGATTSSLGLNQSPLGNVVIGDTFSVQVTPISNNITGPVFTSVPVTVTATSPVITIAVNPPVITSVPITVSGSVLTAAPVATDPSGSPITFSYQWLQGGVAIPGATSSTLDLSQPPLGNVHLGDTFSVSVTPTNGNNATGVVFTSQTETVTGTNPITVAISPPVVTAAPITLIGTVLTVTPAATDPNNSPVTFTYQWLKNSVVIAGATSASLDLSLPAVGNVQVGDQFTVQITPTNGNNVTGAVFTGPPAVVTGINPITIFNGVNNSPPVITNVNVALNGSILSAQAVATDPNNSPVTFTYQWLQDGVVIPNATASTLDLSQPLLGAIQIGDTFSVKVTPTNGNNVSGSVFTSTPVTVTGLNPITVVVNPPVVTSAPITLNGSVLTVTPAATDPSNSPVTFAFQWLRNGVAVLHATTSTFDLSQPVGSTNIGDVISVQVTPTNGNNVAGAVFTSTSVTVTAVHPFTIAVNPPVVTSAPIALNGNVLMVTPVATDPANTPVTFTYQWLQNDLPIASATTDSLDLSHVGPVQVGDTFSVQVTPTDGNDVTGAVFTSLVTISGTNPFTIGPG